MAEGGSSVDSGVVKLCEICEEGGHEVNAVNFCLICEQYLCVDCRNYHKRVKATRSHEVTGTENIPSVSSRVITSESIETPVCKEHERKFDFFCKTHMVELCLACRRMEHKLCEKVIDIKTAEQELFSIDHGIKILKSIKDLLEGFSDCKTAAESIKGKLPGKKDTATDSVKQARKYIDSYLDKIQAKAYTELDTIYNDETRALEEQINTCAASIAFLQKRVYSLERVISIGDDETKFVEINKTTIETKQYCSMLRDLYQETFEKELTFQQNLNIARLNELLNDLGKCSLDKAHVSCTFSGPRAIYTGEIKVKTKTDTDEPDISSFKELPDGRKLLVDWRNKKLKMFDGYNLFQSEIILPGGVPSSLVLLSSTVAIVSAMSNMLHYVNIGNVLTLIETTNRVGKRYFGIEKHDADIVSSLDYHGLRIAVIDKSGDIERMVFKDTKKTLSRPWCVAVSADQNTVYVLDLDKGCIGYTLNGTVVFQYQDPNLKAYFGLVVGSDCLFIGARSEDGNCLVTRRLSLSGEADIPDLYNSRPLKIVENEIILFTMESNGNRVVNFCFLLR